MTTNRRIHARNVRFYMLILNVAFMLIFNDREHPVLPRCHDRSAGRDGTGDYAVVRGSLAAKMTSPAFAPLVTGERVAT